MAQQIAKTRLSFIEILIVVIGLPIALIVFSMSYNNWMAHTAPGSVQGIPSISAEKIDDILCKVGSPACHTGQDLYNEAYRADIDASFALAVFHEGNNYGKLTCNPSAACISLDKTWKASYRAWFKIIKADYVENGISTSDGIIAKLNPPNAPQYAQAVSADVKNWQAA